MPCRTSIKSPLSFHSVTPSFALRATIYRVHTPSVREVAVHRTKLKIEGQGRPVAGMFRAKSQYEFGRRN